MSTSLTAQRLPDELSSSPMVTALCPAALSTRTGRTSSTCREDEPGSSDVASVVDDAVVRFHLHPDVSLTVFRSGPIGKEKGEPLTSLPGQLLSLDEEAWIVVGSGGEHLVRFDLAELFNLDRQTSYTVRFRVEGFGKSTLVLPAIP